MTQVRPDTPDTIPELLPTVATEVLLLVHVPPDILPDKVVVVPEQSTDVPLMVAEGCTVTTVVAKQPVPNIVYVIVAVPDDTPVTVPLELTVAIVVLLLLQVPPNVVLVSEVVPPVHKLVVPLMADGSGLTVNVANTPQPVGRV